MLQNYIKIAIRFLWKYKTNSFVSIAGLAFGISCFLMLATYIVHEFRYDRFFENNDRIARINLFYQYGEGEASNIALTPTAVAPTFKREFQEVEKVARIYPFSVNGSVAVRNGDQVYQENKVVFADSTLFDIFSFPFIEGNKSTALSHPNSVVIDQSTARKYFKDQKAVGKTISMDERYNLLVTGVISDIPSYSHIKFNCVGSYTTLPRSKNEVFNSANDYTYVLLRPNVSMARFQDKVNAFVRKNLGNPNDPASKVRLDLEKLTDIHLYSTVSNQMEASGNSRYIYILSGIAVLILLIACTNFVNLVTARAAIRIREIGVRKVIGAVRSQLFMQHMFESSLTAIVSTILALVITFIGLPELSLLTGSSLSLSVWPGSSFQIGLVVLVIVITLISGAYPAAILSGFQPAKVLKGNRSLMSDGVGLRNVLVVFQFSVSMLFIIATLIANQQLDFIQNKNLGLNPEQIIVVDMSSGIPPAKLESIKGDLMAQTSVKSVSASYGSPLDIQGGYAISAQDKPTGFYIDITAIPVEKDFVQTMGIKLLIGETFSATDIAQVTQQGEELRRFAFLLNESAVKAMGWSPTQAIGKEVNMNGRQGRVKGVLKDFHFRSMHEKIGPIAIIPEYDYFGKLLVKTTGADATQAISLLAKSWKKNFPLRPFEYHFLDQEFEQMYQTEARITQILRVFSSVTILISCLGLFALIAFMSQQRTKEIGVRKVLGASIASIIMLLSKDVIKLIIIAVLIASPLAWYAMHHWLNDFAYHIEIGAATFVFASIIAIVITLATISFESIKAALMNPVKSLKSE
ncbi:putative ABC transport system permease protein [Dyadobacter soli]|uniref:Putative ABC transport system permease protein n=1 Tax=Dyadobacter soli TaxID=659014 RepID=A0A1G8CW84_9BACT|nr:ABC transporter permease [Dyadobacter soli]SDH49473.1 putative ABC transport system permease protein [Dyadobacter soli]